MFKLLTSALFGILAGLVFAAPAMASPIITDSGATLEPGKSFTLIGQESFQLSFSISSIECNDFWLTGRVAENSSSGVTLTIEKASFHNESSGVTSECSGAAVSVPELTNEGGSSHWCMGMNEELGDEFELRWASCGSSGGTFTIKLGPCGYTRSAALIGSFKTNTTPATFGVEHEPLFTHESEFCPLFKVVKWKYRLYRDAGTIAESTEDPLTVS